MNVDGVKRRLALVNQLPPELFLAIFLRIDDPPPGQSNVSDNWQAPSHRTMWPVVLRVCKGWYDVACNAPLLWQDIHVYSRPDWLRLSLQRSRTALVDVTLQNHQGYSASIPLLIDQADRLRTLAILDSEHGGFHLVKRLLLLELPNLQELCVSGENYARDKDHLELQPPMGRWPSIRVLRLTHLVIPAKSAIFSTLRVLDLSHLQDNPKMHTLPLDFALNVLQGCHELHELKLNSVFPELVGRSGFTVSLPQLRRLEVISKVSPTARSPFPASPLVSMMILRHVELPLHAALKFVSHVKPSTPVGYRSFIPLENPSYIPILGHATYAHLRPDSFICSEPGGGTLEVAVEFDNEDEQRWFDQDRQLIDLSFLLARAPLTHLSLTSSRLHSGAIATAFGTFPALTTLEFATVPTSSCRPRDWRFPALFSCLVLPREVHVHGRGRAVEPAADDETDEESLRARLPLRSLRVLRFNALLWEGNALELLAGTLYARFALGAPALAELFVATYGRAEAEAEAELEAGEADEREKEAKAIEMLGSLVDGPVVCEDAEQPGVSSSPGTD